MAEIHKTVTIDAPAARVFDIVDDPEHYPKYVPNVGQVVDLRRSDRRIGDSFASSTKCWVPPLMRSSRPPITSARLGLALPSRVG